MDHAHHGGNAHKDHIGHSNIGKPQGDHMMMHHAMSFHFGTSETILFDFWKTETALGILVSCVIISLAAFLMETIRFFREYRKAQTSLGQEPIQPEDRLRLSPRLDWIDPILQFFQLTLAYCLMLVFMTFNIYLCAWTVIGEIISHLFYTSLFPNLSFVSGHC